MYLVGFGGWWLNQYKTLKFLWIYDTIPYIDIWRPSLYVIKFIYADWRSSSLKTSIIRSRWPYLVTPCSGAIGSSGVSWPPRSSLARICTTSWIIFNSLLGSTSITPCCRVTVSPVSFCYSLWIQMNVCWYANFDCL